MVRFEPGQDRAAIRVLLLDDGLAEATEIFSISLINAEDAALLVPGDLLEFAVVFLPIRIGVVVVTKRILRRPSGRWLSAYDACADAGVGALRDLLWAALLFFAFSWATLGAMRPAVWQEAWTRPWIHGAAAFLVRQIPDDLLSQRPQSDADPWRR